MKTLQHSAAIARGHLTFTLTKKSLCTAKRPRDEDGEREKFLDADKKLCGPNFPLAESPIHAPPPFFMFTLTPPSWNHQESSVIKSAVSDAAAAVSDAAAAVSDDENVPINEAVWES